MTARKRVLDSRARSSCFWSFSRLWLACSSADCSFRVSVVSRRMNTKWLLYRWQQYVSNLRRLPQSLAHANSLASTRRRAHANAHAHKDHGQRRMTYQPDRSCRSPVLTTWSRTPRMEWKISSISLSSSAGRTEDARQPLSSAAVRPMRRAQASFTNTYRMSVQLFTISTRPIGKGACSKKRLRTRNCLRFSSER